MPIIALKELQRGDALVSVANPRNWIHLGIAAALRSPFVHCSTYDRDGLELSTTPDGLRRQPINDPFILVCRYIGGPKLPNRATDVLASMLGQPYNFQGAAAVGVEKLSGMSVPIWARGPHTAKFCSEGLSSAWVQAGDDLLPDVEDGRTTPGDLVRSPRMQVIGVLVR